MEVRCVVHSVKIAKNLPLHFFDLRAMLPSLKKVSKELFFSRNKEIVWEIENSTLIEKIFREINSVVTVLVVITLNSQNFF